MAIDRSEVDGKSALGDSARLHSHRVSQLVCKTQMSMIDLLLFFCMKSLWSIKLSQIGELRVLYVDSDSDSSTKLTMQSIYSKEDAHRKRLSEFKGYVETSDPLSLDFVNIHTQGLVSKTYLELLGLALRSLAYLQRLRFTFRFNVD